MSHPLAQLPSCTVLRWRPEPRTRLAVLISRGVSPVMPTAAFMAQTERAGAGVGCAVVVGYPAAEAKNRAAELALEHKATLILVEDDILAHDDIWQRALSPIDANTVRVASARCRGSDNGIEWTGPLNTKFDADGAVLYSGTVLLVVPYEILARFPQPFFKPYDFGITDSGEFIPRGDNKHGRHSDVWFWRQLRDLVPRPRVEVIGQVTHLRTPFNGEGVAA